MDSFTVEDIWREACSRLQQNMTSTTYNTWIATNPLTEFRLIGDDRAIGVITSPTAFHSTNIEKNFYAQIKEVLDQITGRNSELQFRVGTPIVQSTPQAPISPTLSVPPQPTQPEPPLSGSISALQARLKELAAQEQQQPLAPTPSQQVPQSPFSPPPASNIQDAPAFSQGLFSQNTIQSMRVDRSRMQAQRAGLRLDYTFDTFAVSTTNEMAHAAALAVSSQPGTAYNPLFIYGGVGVGKTHLMHAVGNNILKNNPDSKILYCTGEDFTNEIVSAIQMKKTMVFKEKYRAVDILLIDDVQFIAGKNTVQEEFFHTFNTITKRSGQVILTSDKPPHEIGLIEDRLRSRFEAGLMVDIQQPSFELRTAILLIKATAYHLSIPMNLAQIIASKVDSARKIEGIMKSLKSEVELKHREITPELIDEIFKVSNETNKEKLRIKPFDIIKTVSEYYHIKQSVIRGQQRIQSIVRARHVAMYFMKSELGIPLVEIGRWFSNRDHTSVLHAMKKIEAELKVDEDLMQEVASIRPELVKLSK